MNMVNHVNGSYCHEVPMCTGQSSDDVVVLKIRVANSNDMDFIETELSKQSLNYASLVSIICTEFEISPAQISRLRKLPNTRIRNDNDVKRLINFQEIEVVLHAPSISRTTNTSNAYPSITSKDQTVLY